MQASEGHYIRIVELADAIRSESYSTLAGELLALQRLSHQNMRGATSTTRWAWQILYADSCILHSIILLATSTASQSLGVLDQAIIIAGGGDENRLNLILSLINNTQQIFLPPPTQSQRLLNKGHHSSFGPLFTANNQVPSIDSDLSFLSFQNTHSKSPFVIRGYARDWPALNENPWNSIDYLLSASGPSRLVPVEVGHDYRDEDWNQVLMDWEDFLDALDDTSGKSRASQDNLYLAQHNLLRQFPSLRNDIIIPDYVYCSLTPRDFSGYRAPENADGAILNVWLGPEGAMSPAHFVSFRLELPPIPS
jgi:lysine-specific demethylase 8